MKVKRLIEDLKKFNPDAEVKTHHPFGNNVVFCVGLQKDNNVVFLEDISDIDLKAQFNEFIEQCESNDVDELDFYIEVLEHGITPDVLKENDMLEEAEHMEIFCEEHGLI